MKNINAVTKAIPFSLSTCATNIADAIETTADNLIALNKAHPEWYLEDNANIPDIFNAFSRAFYVKRGAKGVGIFERVPSDQKGKEKLKALTVEQAKKIKEEARLVTFTVDSILMGDVKQTKKDRGQAVGAHMGAAKRLHAKYMSKTITTLKADAKRLDDNGAIKEDFKRKQYTFAEKAERAMIGSKTEVLKNSLDVQVTNDKHLSDAQKAAVRLVLQKATAEVIAICK
jgi:hypothetical protein